MLDFAKYLLDRLKDKRDSVVTVREEHYSLKADGTLGDRIAPVAPLFPGIVTGSTLSGLLDSYRARLDGLVPEKVAFCVEDIDHVGLVALQADEYGRRRVYAAAVHKSEAPFAFDTYTAPEKFRIDFQASFYLTEDAVKVLKLVSSLGTKGEEFNVTDDGIAQTVEIKAGTITRGKVDLPSEGIPLTPWRTFRDVAPVTSKFLLRLKSVSGVPTIALHEIDAKWRVDTIGAIKSWIITQEPKAIVIG